MRPLEPAVCYDCRLFYFHKASGTFQWDQQTQKLVDGTVVYLPLISQLAQRVPLWEMTCTKDPQAAAIAYEAMSHGM